MGRSSSLLQPNPCFDQTRMVCPRYLPSPGYGNAGGLSGGKRHSQILTNFAVKGGAVSLRFRPCWRSRESGANLSLPEFPANREFNREFCNSGAPKSRTVISKPHISEEKQAFRHKSEQGICRDVSGNRIQLSAMRAAKLLAEAELLKPGSIDPGTCAGHAFLPERIPTAHSARPSSRECHDTTSQSSGREAGDPRG